MVVQGINIRGSWVNDIQQLYYLYNFSLNLVLFQNKKLIGLLFGAVSQGNIDNITVLSWGQSCFWW